MLPQHKYKQFTARSILETMFLFEFYPIIEFKNSDSSKNFSEIKKKFLKLNYLFYHF
jgi:hypothetical protein